MSTHMRNGASHCGCPCSKVAPTATGVTRPGRRGKNQCERCRRLKRGKKAPCIRDPNDPTGPCIPCKKARISANVCGPSLPPRSRRKAVPADLRNWSPDARAPARSPSPPTQERPEHGLDQQALPSLIIGSSTASVPALGAQDITLSLIDVKADHVDFEPNHVLEAWLEETYGINEFLKLFCGRE
jgi:hypothetical protein